MFFSDNRLHFFRPLNGKYREHVQACLSLLYSRQYGPTTDFGHSLSRPLVIEILEEALIELGDFSFDETIEEQDNNGAAERFKSTREHANWVFTQLIEFGWLERQADTATLQSTYPFSRMGRVFSQTLFEAGNTKVRTRHRNTRNTLNALDAFASRGETHDLIDAFNFSGRFQPDIQIRLSADSVEMHRDHIDKRIRSIRRKKNDFKKNAEAQLRHSAPDLCDPNQSYLYYILDAIERRMHNAAEIMLPALRNALHGFTKRADIIIRQLSYLNTQRDNDLIDVCRELADLPQDEYQQRLENASLQAASFQLKLIDPQQIKLTERKIKDIVDNTITKREAPSKEAQCELLIQQLLDQAFVMNSQSVKEYIIRTLRDGRKLSTKEMQITNSDDLLAMAHAIEVAGINNLSSDYEFRVHRTGNIGNNDYFQKFDEHEIEFIDHRGKNSG